MAEGLSMTMCLKLGLIRSVFSRLMFLLVWIYFPSMVFFPWSNNRFEEPVFERLHKCFGNTNWFDCYSEMFAKHLDFWCSDHGPMLMSFEGIIGGVRCGSKKRSSRFYFEHAWRQDLNCSELIASNWNNPRVGTLMSGFMENLSVCGNRLAHWGKDKFWHMSKEISILKEKSASFIWSNDLDSWKEMKNNEKRLNELLSKEEKYWRQRSRVNWLKEGY
ncbi:hypothetical protein UlMin_022720 [Ulmus minor]